MEKAGYLRLLEQGQLGQRVEALRELMSPCALCPRRCGARRLEGERGACNSGELIQVASVCRHRGEEPPISGTAGSGTIFAAHCNLRCLYCQNAQISRQPSATEGLMTAGELAQAMLDLQGQGCHNINFVSPTHYAPQLIEAVALAAAQGLHVPLVYNTNAYDSPRLIELLGGIIDIYLPDLKYADPAVGLELSGVTDYPAHARAAIELMWRQTGPLRLSPQGQALHGTLVRHLVLPNDLSDTEDCLAWLSQTCGPALTVSLMAQYYPAHRAPAHPLLARPLSVGEYNRAVRNALRLGLTDLLTQDPQQAPENYQPDFTQPHPFENDISGPHGC